MKYVRVPRELHVSDVLSEEACFSPGRYVRFDPPKSTGTTHYIPLDKLVILREEPARVRKDETYRYAEIGDIDVQTGTVRFREMKGYCLPTQRPAITRNGDVLISTVRTYRKGVGIVTATGNNLVTTNAVLILSGVTGFAPTITLRYVYAFLRSDFFVEQVWSLLHRGVYRAWTAGRSEESCCQCQITKNFATTWQHLARRYLKRKTRSSGDIRWVWPRSTEKSAPPRPSHLRSHFPRPAKCCIPPGWTPAFGRPLFGSSCTC